MIPQFADRDAWGVCSVEGSVFFVMPEKVIAAAELT
jgi:hypothetical protein